MGLAKKGSKKIVISDVSYRWVVSPDDGYMVLVVELAENPGQRLQAMFSYEDEQDPESGVCHQRFQITPKVVISTILSALSKGWLPEKHGLSPMRLDCANITWQGTG